VIDAAVIGNTDGIGLALTRQLLDRGFEVTGISRRASELVHEAYRHSVMDVCDPRYRELLRESLPGEELRLCIYCPGIGEPFSLENMAFDALTIEVNLVGLVRTPEVVVPRMVQNGRGAFVGLSSLADLMPSFQVPAYAASKAGMSYYLQGLAAALANKGVAIANVRLGFVDTKMAKSPWKPFMIGAEDAARRILQQTLGDQINYRINIPRGAALIFGAIVPILRLVRLLRPKVRASSATHS
jgi:short-subunit dehydrogenase